MDKLIKILLVEDNPVDALIITKALKEGSYGNATLYTAASLADAIKFAGKEIPLLLLDLKLPDSEGLNTVKQIRKYFPLSVLIILTHLDDIKIAAQALREGAQNYISKREINSRELDKAIRFSLERHLIIQKLIAANTELALHNAEREKRSDELVLVNKELIFQGNELIKRADELKAEEEKTFKTNRLYAFISQVNQKIVRVKNEEALFRNACQIAIDYGKFKMAWIGLFDKVSEKITLVDQSGIIAEDMSLFTDASYQNNNPQDNVLRTRTYYVSNNIENDLNLENKKSFAAERGIRSSIILPIRKWGNIIGTFNLYSTESGFFDKEEIALLTEVASDISFALDLFEKDRLHKKAEHEIKASEKRFHSLFDNMLEAFAYCKMIYENGVPKDFIYLGVNAAFEKLTGLKNVTGKKVTEIIPHIKEDSPELFETYNRVAQTGLPERFEIYLKAIEMWLDISVYSNEKEYFTCVFDVITERKISEHKQEFDKNNLDALINNTTDLMWSVDMDFKLITFNKPFDDIIRLMSGKGLVKGNNILSVSFSPEQLTRYAKFYERAFAGEVFTEIEYNTTPVEFWSEISFYPIRKGEEIIGTACHSRDITQRKKAEESMKESETRFREIFDSAPQGIVVIDVTNFKFVKYNNNALNILKYSGDEILKKGPADVSPQFQPDGRLSQDKATELITNALNGEKIVFEWVIIDVNGVEIICEIRLVVLSATGGPQVLINFIDITERNTIEKEREKMTSDIVQRNKDLEQFSYIISHNLRAPVANIIGLSSMVEDESLDVVSKKEVMQGISSSVKKLDEVIIDLNNILNIRQNVNQKKETVHFSAITNDIHSSIENMVEKEKAVLLWDFSEADEMNTIKSYLHSIFYNLISNSIKYHQPGIPPIIEIKSIKTKNKIELLFKDNGMGIDLQNKGDQVFGLYKRFHPDSAEGKGMGLYMVKTQVESLGGKLMLRVK